MNPLEQLLNSDPSVLTRLAHAAVAGLATTLEKARNAFPGDPAAEKARLASVYLRNLLAEAALSPHGGEPGSLSPASPADESQASSSESPWEALLRSWARTSEWNKWIGQVKPIPPEQLPKALWLLTHRLPPDVARKWQEDWKNLNKNPQSSSAQVISVAGPADLLLCPQLPDGSPAVRMSFAAEPDSRLACRSFHPLVRQMALVASALLWFLDQDPTLVHAWAYLHRFGVSSLADPQRAARYRNALVQRFESLQQAEEQGNVPGLITAWCELDEAVQSLFYEPIPHNLSAFNSIARASHDCISLLRSQASQAGISLHIQVPTGLYSQIQGLSDPLDDVDLSVGGQPGEILRCLRVYMKLNQTVTLARLACRRR
jgi:plasmid stabilization system protein ParE